MYMYIQLLTRKPTMEEKGYYSACLQRMGIVFLNFYTFQTINLINDYKCSLLLFVDMKF